ncbi:DUF2207 domain-containing protein [uncultured Cohaesibacter sp.]|uniref:DUF2207 domain-containing protein n=1 Tax=uncultured Cohaesibacter sp. TaxID=1002546 RepID=UPI0029C63472|nr:DUF2207 domain-containing protein [uncultured Cohaesibacter sp.]
MTISTPVRLLTLFFILILAGFATQAQARERITDYRVAIQVNKDRTVDITEKIAVFVEGNQIKRGLLRDIPETYRRKDGRFVNINPDILSVMRDGQQEPYQTSHEGRYFRLRIGDADVLLRNGLHSYEISYRVEQSIGFFEDYDEIYWSAIGTEWAFPIEKAEVAVLLPEGGHVLQYAAYTGSYGSAGNSYRITDETEGSITFEATRPFDSGEGMTVAVAWPKGVVEEPGQTAQALSSFMDNSPLYIVILAAIAEFVWLFYSWLKVGRDPNAGAIIPLFRAPDKISPAIASYIHGLGEFGEGEQKTFIAALISMATKGLITIKEAEKGVEIIRQDAPGVTIAGKKRHVADAKRLPVGERALFRTLFKKRDMVKLADMKYAEMSKIMAAFTRAVDREADETYYHENIGRSFIGLLLTIVAAVLFILLKSFFAPPFEFPVLEVVGTAILSFFLTIPFLGIGALVSQKLENAIKGIILAALVAASCYILMVGQDTIFPGLYDFVEIAPVLLLLFMWLLALSFYQWMKAPTLLGRQVMDKIDGLKLFMTVTVAQQAEQANAADMPDLTPELYEDLLPYAIALGVERKWSETFETKVFSQLPPERAYHPIWYVGAFNAHEPSAALAQVTDAIGTNLSSAMTPPASSSSGSSGGGFSGGGGGGGGGGGW